MASLDDMFRSDLGKGIALGIGAALLVPVAATVLAPVLKPAARTALKAGMLAFERGRETFAELGEMMEDMVAETQAELRAAREAGAAGAEGATGEEGAATSTSGPAEVPADAGASGDSEERAA
jgi:hypothetical protein